MPRLSTISSVGGALVAGLLVYTVHASMRDQTHFMVSELNARAAAFEHASDDAASGARRAYVRPSSFHPGEPTFAEEIKARWNVRRDAHPPQHYLTKGMNALHRVDPIEAVARPAQGAPAFEPVESVRDALRVLAPNAADAQPKIGILHRHYGDANTHYLGQGASLR